MPTITLSVPREIYEKMKKYKEVKWSEVARKSIIEYLEKLKEKSKAEEILESLSPATRELLGRVPKEGFEKLYKRIKEKEWKRVKSLTPAF